jgi:phosphatidylserine decarboxylase
VRRACPLQRVVAADEWFAQVPSLFVRNERACILGSWALKGMPSDVLNTAGAGEGLKFGMAAVGAYNVGGITLYCNPALCSNASADDSRFDGGVARSVVDLKPPVALSAGDLVGSFRIGSTLVRDTALPSVCFCNIWTGTGCGGS